jgi:hypothetical protein
MHRITRRSMLVLVVIGALVAGGAAYTNSLGGGAITTSGNVAGYDHVAVNGAVLGDVVYTFDASGTHITAATFTFTGQDLTGKSLAFGLGTTAAPTIAACAGNAGVGVAAGGTGVLVAGDYNSTDTVVTCDGLNVLTNTATDLGVLVSNN